MEIPIGIKVLDTPFRMILAPVFLGVGLLVAAAFLWAVDLSLPGWLATGLAVVSAAAGLLVGVVWVFRPLLSWFTTRYVLTTRRIITRTGLIATRGKDMPLSKVNDECAAKQ